MKCVVLLAVLALPCSVAFAAPSPGVELRAYEMDSMSMLASVQMPSSGQLQIVESEHDADVAALVDSAPAPKTGVVGGLRKLLADFAVTLRDIRYRRGGREPSTGFDCSGFVRYVFHHSLNQELPGDSASQFLVGAKVDRDEMKTGDLVFFRTRGKRISHVGIYLGDGRFIHSPSSGKRVSISDLSEAYWAKHFVGAKRPHVLS
jgi:hypothetical protein